jgi:Protein of unknown function (DUF3224)
MEMNTPTTTTASTTTVREPASWASRVGKATLVASLASLPLTLVTPAHAAMDQFSGVGVLDTANQCDDAPDGFDQYTLVMTGDLEGCLYTNILTDRTTPSGVYLETGQEIFVGSLNGGPEGTFTTTYKFEAKFAPDGSEIHGRCQHPIVDGSGTGGFEGASGRLNFKDIVETGEFVYKGHLDLG